MSSRPAWSTERVPGQAPKLQEKPCLENKQVTKRNSGVVVYICNPKTGEVEKGRFLGSPAGWSSLAYTSSSSERWHLRKGRGPSVDLQVLIQVHAYLQIYAHTHAHTHELLVETLWL